MPEDLRTRIDAVNPVKEGDRSKRIQQHIDKEAKPALRGHIDRLAVCMRLAGDPGEFEIAFAREFDLLYQLELIPTFMQKAS